MEKIRDMTISMLKIKGSRSSAKAKEEIARMAPNGSEWRNTTKKAKKGINTKILIQILSLNNGSGVYKKIPFFLRKLTNQRAKVGENLSTPMDPKDMHQHLDS